MTDGQRIALLVIGWVAVALGFVALAASVWLMAEGRTREAFALVIAAGVSARILRWWYGLALSGARHG